MTLAGLSLRTRTEYEQATDAEARLRTVVDTMPGWLYDASGMGSIIDDLNHARHLYEMDHPSLTWKPEPRIEP